MKSILTSCIALSFVHYAFSGDMSWEVIVSCQDAIICLLTAQIFIKIPYEDTSIKRAVLAFFIWRLGVFSINLFWINFSLAASFIIVESIWFGWLIAKEFFIKPYAFVSDAYDENGTFFLLSQPKEFFGLLLTATGFPFGNRMIVHNGYLYYVNMWRFCKRPFRNNFLRGRVLLRSSRGYDSRLDGLTGRVAIPAIRDCGEYERIFGSVKKILRDR